MRKFDNNLSMNVNSICTMSDAQTFQSLYHSVNNICKYHFTKFIVYLLQMFIMCTLLYVSLT